MRNAIDVRWAKWAAAMATRLQRVAGRWRYLTLRIRRLTVGHPARSWNRASYLVTPHVHLSVQPILRTMGTGRGGRSPGDPRVKMEAARSIGTAGRVLPEVASYGEAGAPHGPAFVRGTPSGRAGSRALMPLERVFVRAVAVRVPTVTAVLGMESDGRVRSGLRGSTGSAASSRVTNRGGVRHSADSGLRSERASRTLTHSLLRRIVDERGRVESRAPSRRLVSRSHSGPYAGARTHKPRPDATTIASPLGPVDGAPPMATGDVMSMIDVDRLTDRVIRQLDRQVIARRERMGKTS